MSQDHAANTQGRPVAVVVGATSKWQSDGRNTRLAHGKALDDSNIPVGARWGVGGAVAQKFAQEGFFVVLTTRTIPPTLTPRTVANAIPRPAWWFNFLTTEPLAFASLDSWSGTVAIDGEELVGANAGNGARSEVS